MNFLERVRRTTAARLARSKEVVSRERLARICEGMSPPRSFINACRRPPGEGIRIIAEVKRASPSRGPINPGLLTYELARAYERGGADAISVLTEPEFFSGCLNDLEDAVRAVELPVLRKDFILDDYQLLEARACGASAVLLMASLLPPGTLRGLLGRAGELGLDALVEVHDERQLAMALEMGAELIGVNNRDLQSLRVDLGTSKRLLPLIPDGKVAVSESGYSDAAQVAAAMRMGAHAVLVGGALAGHGHPQSAVAGLKGARP
jgi:indole-3-glycerol phosphate synthase